MIRKFLTYLFVFYVFSLLIGTIIPWSTSNKIEFFGFYFRIDRLLHFFSYMGMTFLFIFLKYSHSVDGKGFSAFYQSIWIAIFGFSTEVIQLFIPYRRFSLKDFRADVAGILVAIIICLIFRNLLIKMSDKNLIKCKVNSKL
jgi:VanZ family protein